jgi:hypothetical protein
LTVAVRARFPKLALALGDEIFDTMLASFVAQDRDAKNSLEATSSRLPRYLASTRYYPLWYAELAVLDRAHALVSYAPPSDTLARHQLTITGDLRLVPAHVLVLLMTAVDELWTLLDYLTATDQSACIAPPQVLAASRTVIVWRQGRDEIRNRTVEVDEARALRAAARGSSLREIASITGDYVRALDIVSRWIDDGMLLS